MLFGLLRIILCCMKSGLHDATLLDRIYFMLRYFTLPTSYQAAWCLQKLCMLCELVVMVLSWWIFYPHTLLPDISYIMLICFIFHESCFSVWSCLPDATLPARLYLLSHFRTLTIYMVLFCFTFTKSCLASWSCLHGATLHDVICFMLPCFTLSTSCQTVSCPLHQVKLFDLVFTMLRCLTSSTSCYQDWPSPRQALPLHLSDMTSCGLIRSSWY